MYVLCDTFPRLRRDQSSITREREVNHDEELPR
jgi:hypothetical protein